MPYRKIDWHNGEVVIAYLNDQWPPGKKPRGVQETRSRISDLVEALTKIKEYGARTFEKYEGSVFEDREKALDLHRAVTRANDLIRPYALSPSIPFTDIWNHDKKSSVEVGLQYEINQTLGTLKGFDYLEVRAVQAILQLIEDGKLDRLKRCWCGSWWYADRRDQRGCSKDHSGRDYRHTDEFRAAAAKRMQSYRNLNASRRSNKKSTTRKKQVPK